MLSRLRYRTGLNVKLADGTGLEREESVGMECGSPTAAFPIVDKLEAAKAGARLAHSNPATGEKLNRERGPR